MINIFINILSMSLTASYCVLFVFAARLLLKKVPKIYSYLLWCIVGFRLVCPFSFESMFSLLQADKALPITSEWTTNADGWNLSSRLTSYLSEGNPYLAGTEEQKKIPDSVSPQTFLHTGLQIAAFVWLSGILLLISYNIYSLIKLKKRIRNAVPGTSCYLSGKNGRQRVIPVWEIDGLETPFLLGLARTVIYLPTSLEEEQKTYCLAHECTHIRRGDHFIKQLAFFTVCIHWFNPLVWAAFHAMNKDMEMSCDEAVIRNGTIGNRKEYSYTLLSLASEKSFVLGSPLGFGETGVRARIRNILKYKKPAVWISLLSVALVAGMIIGLTTNPPIELPAAVTAPQSSNLQGTDPVENSLMDTANGKLYAQVNTDMLKALKIPDDNAETTALLAKGQVVQVLAFGLSTYETGIEQGWFTSDNADPKISRKYAAVIAEDLNPDETMFIPNEYLSVPENTTLMEKVKWTAKAWADAFCMRNGSFLKQMAVQKDTFSQWDLVLSDSENGIDFGFSSPWPWSDYYLSRPTLNDNDTITITIHYYADTSDPTVTVWLQDLTIGSLGDTLDSWVNDSVLHYSETESMDHIDTLDAFTKAYFDQSDMIIYDYEGSGYIDAIASRTSPLSSADYAYRTPDGAAIQYFHLAEGTSEILSQDDKNAVVRYTFSDGDYVDISMYLAVEIPAIWSVKPQQSAQP